MPLPNIIPFPEQTSFFPITLTPISPSGTFDPDKERLTSSGRPKAREVESLRSYNDYYRISSYFLSSNKIRDYALFTIGIATGLRISDIVSLKFGHICTADTGGRPIFRDSINISEVKTGKRTTTHDDMILVTEAVKEAVSVLTSYYKKKKINVTLDSWLFISKQPQRNETIVDEEGNVVPNPLYREYVLSPTSAHRILKAAQKHLNIPYNVGTHTMRKTFASLAYILARKGASTNTAALEQVQLLLRQSDQRTTSRYLGLTRETSAGVRRGISDFLLGKSGVTEITLLD